MASFGVAQNTVLVLNGTVTGGVNSPEALAAIANGMTVELVNDAGWAAKTTADFASYRALILGDPTCIGPGTSPSANMVAATAAVWGPAVDGNVIIIGTDPVYHLSQGGSQLTNAGISFVLDDPLTTGMYSTLSCYYHNAALNTPVPMLDGLSSGGFKVKGVGCFNDVHIVAAHPAMAGLTDAMLSNWSCSVHEAFTVWPSSGLNQFEVLAIAKNAGGEYTAPDGTVGTPFILARGAGLVVISDIDLAPALSLGVPIGTNKTLTATVTENGTPVVGTTVTFTVEAGPNTGTTATDTTDLNGEATFTYASFTMGVDTTRARFVDSAGLTQTSNSAVIEWVFPTTTLTCPPDVVEVWTVGPAGGQTHPSLTGFATYVDGCDPTPNLTYSDTLTPGIHAGEPETVVTRTWTLTDDCGTLLTCTQTITLLSPAQHGMFLDAIPGQCPNELRLMSATKLGVTIVGSMFQSADAIQPSSLRISRLDGVGYMMGGFEPGLVDQVTPDYYAKHACHLNSADGSMDLEVWFYVPFLKKSLKLNNLPDGTVLPVRITGQFFDGTPFEVRDSLIIRHN